ncbi:MAG: hypothetical protein IV100_16270 [Myxococcales bacterium]|nr:hypothetical protein [Myxococcales bacterium]
MTFDLSNFDLTIADGREAALDALCEWFTRALVAANGDRDVATDVITLAIKSFYDVREAADQLRGIYAGHFFLVDAVGLDNTDRPVPWFELHRQVPSKHMDIYKELFDRIERSVE